MCAVADWFRRHHHLSSSHLCHRDYSDTEDRHGRLGDGEQGEDDYNLSDDNEAVGYRYERNSSHRNRNHIYVEKSARSRIPVK